MKEKGPAEDACTRPVRRSKKAWSRAVAWHSRVRRALEAARSANDDQQAGVKIVMRAGRADAPIVANLEPPVVPNKVGEARA
jgi:hypothetical protein